MVFGATDVRRNAVQVRVADQDITLQVRPNQSLLDALMRAGVEMIYDCQRGECGLCAAKISQLEGVTTVDHRDVFVSDREKRKPIHVHLRLAIDHLPHGDRYRLSLTREK
ncbi:2Fe-2S iron-sulfur cluster-binding protein [Mesorhizobium huakuii]|uniref:2Fe-2S iron-sulfur cluster-binding protein n=1 Tax=Mesorhizobium huakuii TaxID=28104 RepID=UPI003908B763